MPSSQLHSYSTERLELIAASLTHLDAELESSDKLAELLKAEVTQEWPPGEYDRCAIEFFRSLLNEGGPDLVGWLGWYAVKRATESEPAVLIAAGGYFGQPTEKGEVEIGYSVVPTYHRKGYATEIVNALVDIAKRDSRVKRIIARTTISNQASKIVLEKAGFKYVGPTDEEGVVLYNLLPCTEEKN